MIRDVQNCFKLLKYGYQLKSNIVCALLFVGIGVMFLLMGHEQMVLSGTYIFLALLFVSQCMYMMLFSSWVAASPQRKKVELRYIDILNVIGGVVAIVAVLLMSLLAKPGEEDMISIEAVLVLSGCMAIVMYVYTGMAFKSMILGWFVFMTSFLFLMNCTSNTVGQRLTALLEGKRPLAIAIFIALVAIGIVLSHVCRRLMYRMNMSKFSGGAKLKMEQS